MRSSKHSRRSARLLGGLMAMVFTLVFLAATTSSTRGGDHPWGSVFHTPFGHQEVPPGQIATLNGGAWHWVRSPEQEKTVAMNLFNRYCIRCHGVDGRGVWDIPGIPDFTDVRWQNYRSDADIVRIVIEGRGAVMPQFRGAVALDEAWGLAHYLRTFVPGTQMSRPVLRNPPGQAAPTAPAAAAPASGAAPKPAVPATAAPRSSDTATIPPPVTLRSSASPFAR